MTPIRVIDTGRKPAHWNVAMTAALRELHRAGRIPDSVRFHRFPPSVYRHLCWDIVAERDALAGRLGQIGELIGRGIANGLARMGLPARFQPRDQVVIGGRKIAASRCSFEGPTVVCHGHVLTGAADVHGRPATGEAVSLRALLGRIPADEEVQGLLIAGLSHVLRRPFANVALGDEEAELAERICNDATGALAIGALPHVSDGGHPAAGSVAP